ncbi:MAG: tetratricopeptide repeat protein [Chitinophagaceae bacterium]
MRGRISPIILLSLLWVSLACLTAGAQTFTISGRVVDKQNQPTPGVRITVQRGQAIIDSKVTGATGDYTIAFQTGDPVTIIYAGGGWLPNRVQNLSGRTNHSLGKVLSRVTETASLTPDEIDEVASAYKYLRLYSALYAREIAEYENLPPVYKGLGPGIQAPNNDIIRRKQLPDSARGFEPYAERDPSDRLTMNGTTRVFNSDSVEVRMGAQLYGQGKYQEAVKAFMRGASANPKLFMAQYGLGLSYEALGQYEKAASAYSVAVTLTPENSIDLYTAYYNLGNSYAAAGKHLQAIDAYQRLLAAEPNLAQPHYNLGLSLAALKRNDEAVTEFRKAVELKPDYSEAYYNLGLTYSKLEQYAKAIDSLKAAIRTGPNYTAAHYNLGVIYYLTDNRHGLAEQQQLLRSHNPQLANELANLLRN